ncbi:MAG TPA: hypothetical protein VMY35_04520 [Phycisphaerae bacterium]|nr:hypothetical protein [Phycisphaerae bacterium]
MLIDGLVVCVNYADELALSLPRWSAALDTITVVTSPMDVQTLRLLVNGEPGRTAIRTHITDIFYKGGAHFNKGGAMQEAIERTHPWRDWVLLFDSDIMPPLDLRAKLDAADLQPGILHGAHRHQAKFANAHTDPEGWPQYPDREVAGYFQLFHVSDPAVADRSDVIDTGYTHAGNYDSQFQNRWGPGASVERKRWLDIHVLHVGDPGRNWCGKGNEAALAEIRMARARGRHWTEERI